VKGKKDTYAVGGGGKKGHKIKKSDKR